jgi:D-3-phosphoglycerate dehydrogenase
MANYPLLGLKNTSLFPHIAAKTETAMQNMGWVVRDVEKVLRGEDPVYQVCV